jgi:hypothetical protein
VAQSSVELGSRSSTFVAGGAGEGAWALLLVLPVCCWSGRLGFHLELARADQAAWQRARRPKTAKLAADPPLALVVEAKLRAWWSPEQIAGWLPAVFPDSAEMRVSHETI